jgi:hypothetical protein
MQDRGSTVGVCPAQKARATRTGEVCPWRGGRGGEGGSEGKEGPPIRAVRGWRGGGGVWPAGRRGAKRLGTGTAAGQAVRLSAKRPAEGPTNL